MKGVITEFTDVEITFLEDGVEELQVLDLAEWVKPEFFKTGRAEVTMKENLVSFITMEGDQKEQQKGTVKGTDKSGSWADDMTNFKDLLTDAHKKFPGRLEIFTEIVRDGDGKPLLNVEDKFCVVKAKVVVTNKENNFEQIFEAHGDTLAMNVVGSVAEKHWIRMAETRAIVRALRWATNNATVAAEETSEGEKKVETKKKGEKNAKTQ